MVKYLIKILFKLLLFLMYFSIVINCRKISVELNPNCDECKNPENPINLVHISSKGDNNTIHYLWSSITKIPPTLLIVKTGSEAKLTIKWDQILKNRTENETIGNAITFSEEPINSIGIQLSQLFLFNDIDSKGLYNPSSDPRLDFKWEDIVWENVSIPERTDDLDSIELSFKNSNPGEVYNGSIGFNLRVDSSEGRNKDLPHLAFTQTSASLEFSLTNVQTEDRPEFNKTIHKVNQPKLVATFIVMNEGTTTQPPPQINAITSIDDEYTPGVFNRINLNFNSNKDSKSSENSINSFLHWKPIAYNSNERIIANTLDVIPSNVENVNQTVISKDNSRILEAFFNNRTHLVYGFDLTFGAIDDTNYYDSKKYNSFALVVGLDSAPDDKLSFLVQMIILVGFGLPLIVMVVSALYLIVRKIRKRKFDDLLLSQQNLDNSRQSFN